ncbi:MAG: ankyrin repeat domain-containing protein [Candidatus Margulisbacteria bacterium]|nr:ankyrin repeat domain-containing protein [Candidatus Margulisiibacteriota bacterium]
MKGKIISVNIEQNELSDYMLFILEELGRGVNIFDGNETEQVLEELLNYKNIYPGQNNVLRILLGKIEPVATKYDLGFLLGAERPEIDENDEKTKVRVSIYICLERIDEMNAKLIMPRLARDFGVLKFGTAPGKFFTKNELLIKAADDNDLDKLQLLIKKGADVNATNEEGDTALTLSADKGHIKIVKKLLEIPGINVNTKNNYSDSALILAVDSGHLNVVKELVKFKELEVNAIGENGDTPLMLAAENGKMDIAEVLLHFPGIDISIQNSSGKTALDQAKKGGFQGIISLLEILYAKKE